LHAPYPDKERGRSLKPNLPRLRRSKYGPHLQWKPRDLTPEEREILERSKRFHPSRGPQPSYEEDEEPEDDQ
jgi:hypothetical protein